MALDAIVDNVHMDTRVLKVATSLSMWVPRSKERPEENFSHCTVYIQSRVANSHDRHIFLTYLWVLKKCVTMN